ncbi:MAG: ThiF family adenylyltransferase [Methylophilaceae bacterium]|nr:ThiF family adenylyltransferase [Methylophilaceae bacterium]
MTDPTIPSAEQINACFQAIDTLCASRGVIVTRLNNAALGCVGVSLQGTARSWELQVDCRKTALRLPCLSLRAPKGLFAHVGYNSTVCVNDGQGLSMDLDRHEEIVAHTVLAGFDLLEKWDAVASSQEFCNELEGYWATLPDALRGRASFEPNGVNRLLTGYADCEQKPNNWFFVEQKGTLPPEFRVGKLDPKRVLYVHLEDFPDPPIYPNKVTPAFLKTVIDKFSKDQRKLKLLGPSNKGQKQMSLLVSCPRSSGGYSLVGFVFFAKYGTIDEKKAVLPITVRRHTVSYMRERGGASLNLMKKHIAVLGCGAVGSVVADCLATAGIGKLTLVDNDVFSEDNVFRHVLEPIYIDIPKPCGLKHQLERKYPGLQVTPVNTTGEDWLKEADITNLDGIVLAIGIPTLERIFSRNLKNKGCKFPIVFTWLEPLDIGGHSVLIWGDTEGCLDCIYRDDDGMPVLYPRTSFLEHGQHFTRNLTGCANVFVPFGALQSRKTGLMATDHLLSSLDKEPKSSYQYWVGDGATALEKGLKTTHWWKIANQTTPAEASRRIFGIPCNHCRGGSV